MKGSNAVVHPPHWRVTGFLHNPVLAGRKGHVHEVKYNLNPSCSAIGSAPTTPDNDGQFRSDTDSGQRNNYRQHIHRPRSVRSSGVID